MIDSKTKYINGLKGLACMAVMLGHYFLSLLRVAKNPPVLA